MRKPLIALLTTLASTLALAAGQVDVSFQPVDRLADIGRGSDRERHLKTLAGHFKALGAQLPDGQLLRIEVLDVDLAGELRPFRRTEELRVMKGGADWPALELSWSLHDGGRTLKSGRERLSDMAYLERLPRLGDTRALPHEARMIERWFAERVLGPTASAP